MKRSGIERKTGLTRKTPLARGKPFARTTPLSRSEKLLKRGVVLARKPAKPTSEAAPASAAQLAKVKFEPRESARNYPCARCEAAGRVQRAHHWHHWLAQQHLRVYVRGLRLPAADAVRLLRSLLRDKRNISPLCHFCHMSHEDRMRPFCGEEVPHSARVFALRLGPEWAEKLKVLYPGGGRWRL